MRKFVFLFMLILAACTDETTATRILANEGYEQIRFTGYDWFSCGREDFYATGFIASKNGKLIYENDLIKCPCGKYRIAVDDFGLWTIIYNNNPFEGVGEWSDIVKEYAFNEDNVEIEVIGNIHETPELLEQEND